MAEIFNARSMLYWWGILSASVFIREALKEFAKFLKSSGTFTADKIPFNVLPGLNSWIDGVADYLRTTVKFNPNTPFLTVGTFAVQSWVIAILFGLILLIVVVFLYIRALKSSAWFDDFVVLFMIYVVLRIEGHIVSLSGLPILNSLRMFVDNPASAYFLMMALMLVLTFAGEGWHSKIAFWRAVIEAALVSLFMFPREASNVFSYIVDALAQFGVGLTQPQNVPFAVAWGVIGMLLALNRLVLEGGTLGGGGGGGGKPAGGGGGGGGKPGGGGPPKAKGSMVERV